MANLEAIEDHQQWRQKFPAFPYKPYNIQLDFMASLYHFLDLGGISMLESPTGTGKTLSIICSALQWLVDRKGQRNRSTGNNQSPSDDEPDWMRDFVVKKDRNSTKHKKKIGVVLSRKLVEANHRTGGVCGLFGEKSGNGSNEIVDKRGTCDGDGDGDDDDDDDDEFLVEDYESEQEEDEDGGVCKRKSGSINLSSDEEDEEEKLEEEEVGMKVFFCSRTHSQLSQFIKELRKTVFGSELNVVSLGSRKNLCINQEVLKMGNSTSINERCLELQKSKTNGGSKIKKIEPGGRRGRTKASSGCPMLRKQKLQKEFLSDVSQHEALDIEDLVDLGTKLGTCSYYGSRRLVPAADLVVLPYQSLLSKSSRESLGINLKDNIIIIDEAHNLADTLIAMYDAKITLSQLKNLHQCLENYLEKFSSRLGPGNRRYIQTLMVLTRAFVHAIFDENEARDNETCNTVETAVQVPRETSVMINDFLFSLNIDNINFVKLINYVKESNIIHKVCGYGDKLSCSSGSVSKDGGSILSGFRALLDLLLSLTNKNVDGRIIVSKTRSKALNEQDGFIKYVMLTGEKIFSEIVNQAHAVVLAGGTLQPLEETRERLFPWLPSESLRIFSCGHIIPTDSILPIAVPSGPSGLSFDFSYSSRSCSKMIEELGRLLCNLVTVVPEGIVVFFSSFDYEDKVHEAWRTCGILHRITKKKRVFREPRSSSDIEVVLKEYKDTIHKLSERQSSQNGAILFAVVGGKISEGINFSDGMGRCIVMVGLPYPSPSDVELLERIKHMEGIDDSNSSSTSQLQVSNDGIFTGGNLQTGFDILRRCKRRGKEYYENLCMKAVNQSIGRAIRHINDYAAIMLVDSRYASDPSRKSYSHQAKKLPQWIQDRLISSPSNYGEVHRLLHQFFRHNKNKVS